jgi:hypothetical protein
MRELKTDQQIEPIGICSKTVLSVSDISDHFALLSFDFPTHLSPGCSRTPHCAYAIIAGFTPSRHTCHFIAIHQDVAARLLYGSPALTGLTG